MQARSTQQQPTTLLRLNRTRDTLGTSRLCRQDNRISSIMRGTSQLLPDRVSRTDRQQGRSTLNSRSSNNPTARRRRVGTASRAPDPVPQEALVLVSNDRRMAAPVAKQDGTPVLRTTARCRTRAGSAQRVHSSHKDNRNSRSSVAERDRRRRTIQAAEDKEASDLRLHPDQAARTVLTSLYLSDPYGPPRHLRTAARAALFRQLSEPDSMVLAAVEWATIMAGWAWRWAVDLRRRGRASDHLTCRTVTESDLHCLPDQQQ